MTSKGNNRLNGKRIKRFPLVDDASKTESETPEYMRNQKLPEETIVEIQKKLAEWDKKKDSHYFFKDESQEKIMSAIPPEEESVNLPEKLEELPIPEHLEEVSTKERIELVQDDKARRYGQIVISLVLIAFAIGAVAWYLIYGNNDEFKQYFIYGLAGLVFAGIGAAFAIFGLGRTVARRSQ